MKKLEYYVTKDNITPKDIIEAGFAGEHLSIRVIFNLSEELLEADEYMLHITNGGGEFFATDKLILSDNSIIYDLPNYVTAVSGIVKLQLVLKADGSVIYMFPCELRLLGSAERTSSAINYLSEISDALSICRNVAQIAEETVNTVEDNSTEFRKTAGDIETALGEILEIQEYYIGGNA